MKGSSSLYEFLLMTDEENLYTSLNAFLNLHDSQFCPQGEPFYKVHLILISYKVTAPFKPVHICLMKSVDPVVYELKKVVALLRFAPAML